MMKMKYAKPFHSQYSNYNLIVHKAHVKIKYSFLLISLLLSFSTNYAQALDRFSFSHPQMGTEFRIICYAPTQQIAKAASQEAFRLLDEMNTQMSDYLPNSDLNQLSAKSKTPRTWMIIPKGLREILHESRTIGKQSRGAFAISIGPLVKIWRDVKKSKNLPSLHRLKKARKRVGFQKWNIKSDSLIMFRKNEMKFDLGGIAKGYAADKMLEILQKHGIQASLIDAGGDLRLGDPPPGRVGWTIGLEVFDQAGKAQSTKAVLSNCAIATSGDLYRYVEIDGVRYSHIVNPKTGMALTDRRRATVIASNGMFADALASALSVLQPKKGLRLLRKYPGSEAYIQQNLEGEIRNHASTGFYERIIL